jgi:hypothetical protein
VIRSSNDHCLVEHAPLSKNIKQPPEHSICVHQMVRILARVRLSSAARTATDVPSFAIEDEWCVRHRQVEQQQVTCVQTLKRAHCLQLKPEVEFVVVRAPLRHQETIA